MSPHGERLIGAFAEEVIVVVLALTPRPMSILPAKRLLRLLFCSVPADVVVESGYVYDNVGAAPDRGGNKDGCPGRWTYWERLVPIVRG